MKYQEIIRYPLSTTELFNHFSNPEFFERKYRDQGASNIRVLSAETVDNTSRITVSRDVPVEVDVPSFARSMVPATITLIQTDIWDMSNNKGRLEIEFKGMPVKVHCDMHIRDLESGAHQDLHFDIKVNVPLLGGKLEELLARDLKMKFQKDTEVTMAILSD